MWMRSPRAERASLLLALLLLPAAAQAQAETTPPLPAPDVTGPETGTDRSGTASGEAQRKLLFDNLARDSGEFTLVSNKSGLSFHKPMFVYPVSYSEQYPGSQTEMIFQISLKQRLFARNIYLAYTQKSFWQVYNGDESRPFRETNYNPELFYRWTPRLDACPGCGVDIGVEHESNGRDLPNSRSWNRALLSGHIEHGRSLVWLRTWYRLPEDEKKNADDASGDDNPDIYRYLGYAELRLQHKFRGEEPQMLAFMARGNWTSGKGAFELNYSAPFGDYFYWALNVWHGYGESLIDYDRSITRIGLGVMLAR
jgi:phospholipase A1